MMFRGMPYARQFCKPNVRGISARASQDLKELQRAAYEMYTRNAIVRLRRVKTGSTIEEDHRRNRQMIVHWLIANTDAIKRVRRDGKTYYRVVDVDAWHVGIGRLLREVQRTKSEADRNAAERLFAEFGIHFDTRLRDEVLERFAKLDQHSYTAFVMPKRTATRDANGFITDVAISYPLSLSCSILSVSRSRQ